MKATKRHDLDISEPKKSMSDIEFGVEFEEKVPRWLLVLTTYAEWTLGFMTLILTKYWQIGLSNILISLIFMWIFNEELN